MTVDIRERKRARTNEHMPETNGHGSTNGVNRDHNTDGVDGHSKPNPNPDEWFVGSVDQGTTSSRFIIFSSQADIVASHQIEFDNHYPESG